MNGTVLLTGDHPLQGLTTVQAGTLALDFADSGYTYLIHATSVVGLLFVWLMVSAILPSALPPLPAA